MENVEILGIILILCGILYTFLQGMGKLSDEGGEIKTKILSLKGGAGLILVVLGITIFAVGGGADGLTNILSEVGIKSMVSNSGSFAGAALVPDTISPVSTKSSLQSTPTPASQSLVDKISPTSAPILFAGGWQKIGDLPRQINSIVSDPTTPKVLYAGTGSSGAGSGVYKSEDAGLNWKYASNGLPSEDVESLAFNFDNPPILYAALDRGDIYASTDGAQSWTKLGNAGLMGFKNSLFVAPSNRNVLFIVKDVRGIARSRNGGYAWMPVDDGLPKSSDRDANTQSLAIDPTNENIVYLGTGWGSFNGNGVYKSTDGGETWTPANQNMTDYGITALAVNPKQPQIIYAGTVSGELFKSTNSGQSWNDLTKKVPFKNEIKGIAIDSPETIYLLSERVGIMFSNNGGTNWDIIGKPEESDYPSYTAFSAIFDPKPIIVVGISDEGGWRYTAES